MTTQAKVTDPIASTNLHNFGDGQGWPLFSTSYPSVYGGPPTKWVPGNPPEGGCFMIWDCSSFTTKAKCKERGKQTKVA